MLVSNVFQSFSSLVFPSCFSLNLVALPQLFPPMSHFQSEYKHACPVFPLMFLGLCFSCQVFHLGLLILLLYFSCFYHLQLKRAFCSLFPSCLLCFQTAFRLYEITTGAFLMRNVFCSHLRYFIQYMLTVTSLCKYVQLLVEHVFGLLISTR